MANEFFRHFGPDVSVTISPRGQAIMEVFVDGERVFDKKGEPLLVEVKFRARPDDPVHEDTIKILERLDRFWGSLLVVVNCWEQPYFRIAVPPYLNAHNKMVLSPLTGATRWNIDKDVYAQCEARVHKYMTPTRVPKKK